MRTASLIRPRKVTQVIFVLVLPFCLVQHTCICTWHYFELKQLVMTKLHHLKVEHNHNTNVRMILKATQCTVDSVEVHLHFRTARRTLVQPQGRQDMWLEVHECCLHVWLIACLIVLNIWLLFEDFYTHPINPAHAI